MQSTHGDMPGSWKGRRMSVILVAISLGLFLALSAADVFVEDTKPEELVRMGVEIHKP